MNSKYSDLFEKYISKSKYSLFVFLGIAGIVFLTAGKADVSAKTEYTCCTAELKEYKQQTEQEITQLLKEIDGVGDVKVMISFEAGSENIYAQQKKSATDIQSDSNSSQTRQAEQNNTENEYVIISQKGEDTALVEKTLQPVVQGVAVVCSGAEDISVVSAVTNSVAVVLNIPTNRIYVTKMR